MNRWIIFPESLVFYDPITKVQLTQDGRVEVLTFGDFLNLIMMNPIWSDGYATAQAQDNILNAFTKAYVAKESGMWVLEDPDFKLLEIATKEPRLLHVGPKGAQLIHGFGKHPSMARQFLPMMNAVLQAKTSKPEE
jgi:hypothetical protein